MANASVAAVEQLANSSWLQISAWLELMLAVHDCTLYIQGACWSGLQAFQ